MTDSQKESYEKLAIIECPHRKSIGGVLICLIYDVPCDYIRKNNLGCKAINDFEEGEE